MRRSMVLLILLSVVAIGFVCLRQLERHLARPNAFIGRVYYVKDSDLVERDLVNGHESRVIQLEFTRKGVRVDRRPYGVSGDGQVVAYQEVQIGKPSQLRRSSFLVVVNRSTGKTLLRQRTDSQSISRISLSADGKRMAVTDRRNAPMGSRTQPVIPMQYLRIISVRTGTLLLAPMRIDGGWIPPPSWSPSGDKVVTQDVWSRAMVVTAAGGERWRLPGGSYPVWSPSGRYIVTSRTIFGEDCQMYDMETRARKTIHLPSKCSVFGWSPDSKMLLYTVANDITFDPIYAFDPASHRLTPFPVRAPSLGGPPVIWIP